MAKMVKKGDLARKTCVVCGLEFQWRKKWASCWEQVRYCSERCRRQRSSAQPVNEAQGHEPGLE